MGTRPACSRTHALLFCAFILGQVSSLGSKEFQCAKRQILNEIDLPEFLWDNCIVETGQPSLNKTDCTVWDFGEGEGYYDCSNLQFSLLSSSDSYVSGIEIYPYVKRFPNFLINFRDIQWNYMQYRLHVDLNNVCHRVWFNSSGPLHQGLRVSFACDKVDHGGPSLAYLLEAELLVDVGISPFQITGHAHYTMKVPQSKESVDPLNKSVSIKHWIILVAVDVSHKPDLWVYWPAIPDRYNVSEYIIRINDAEPNVMVDQSSCKDGYCSHKLFAGYFARNISISVQPVHKDCFESCYSYTPNIILETCLPLYIKILAILVPILTVLFMILIVYYFCCTAPQEPLKVLLLFDATTSHHCRVVRKLVDYLKDFCQVHCLIDHAEIPLTESQNPSKWLHKVIDEADSVLYVASPKPYMDIRYSEYPNVVYEALSLIEQHRMGHTDNRPGHYLVAVPPYCSKKNIPESLMDVPRFYIPYELSWLLWSLYNQCCWTPFTWMAKVYLQYAWCPGPMSAYQKHGTLLKEALGVANAHKITEEEKPLDESWIEGTRIGREGDTNDTATIYNYPGRLDALSLSGKLGGYLSSKSNIVAKMTIDVDTLEL